MNPPEIGDTVSFIPAANEDKSSGFAEYLRKPVRATVIFIHRTHRYYRTEFQLGDQPGCIGHECFKF